jgi:hypothetical protein
LNANTVKSHLPRPVGTANASNFGPPVNLEAFVFSEGLAIVIIHTTIPVLKKNDYTE